MDWLIAAVAVAMVIVIVITAVIAVRDRRAAPRLDDEALDVELHGLESTAERAASDDLADRTGRTGGVHPLPPSAPELSSPGPRPRAARSPRAPRR